MPINIIERQARHKTKLILALLIFSIFQFFNFPIALAANISATDKYAWGENIGWITFEKVQVDNFELSGYAWGENVGWINLNCANTNSCASVNFKVKNNGQGFLSGYAWNENTGWISFHCGNTNTCNTVDYQVTIDSNGFFQGYAWGENVGWIVFNCKTTNSCGVVDYKVRTSWRPGQISAGPSGGGGGGSFIITTSSVTVLPSPGVFQGRFSLTINDGAVFTTDPEVTLTFVAEPTPATMMISNYPDFRDGVRESFSPTRTWRLLPVTTEELNQFLREGVNRTVYVKFANSAGQESEVKRDSIILRYRAPLTLPPSAPPVAPPEYLPPVVPPGIMPPPPPVTPPGITPAPPVIPSASPTAPSAVTPIKLPRVVLPKITLPKITLPKLTFIKNLLEGLKGGLKAISQWLTNKLVGLRDFFRLPRTPKPLEEITRLPAPPKLSSEELKRLQELTSPLLQAEPEFLTVRSRGLNLPFKLVDFGAGIKKKVLAVVTGLSLELMVKPKVAVAEMRGFVIFSGAQSRQGGPQGSLIPNELLRRLSGNIGQLAFAEKQDQIFILEEFRYTQVGDQYVATIQTPEIAGEYEILTQVRYARGNEEAFSIFINVAREGYIFERIGRKEATIAKAKVSLYWYNQIKKQYELWPAQLYKQENPIYTDASGRYSFVVPPGFYFLKVEAPGYQLYQGPPFSISKNSFISFAVELKPIFKADWRLLAVAALLLLNFWLLVLLKREKKQGGYWQ